MRKDNYCRIACHVKYIYSDQKERAQKPVEREFSVRQIAVVHGKFQLCSAGGAASRQHEQETSGLRGPQAARRLDLQQAICTQNSLISMNIYTKGN
jgi:hypothetical protein